jgi:hypothetical protein
MCFGTPGNVGPLSWERVSYSEETNSMRTLVALAQQLQSSAISVGEFRAGSIACIELMTVNDVLALAMLISDPDMEDVTMLGDESELAN